ncbi:presenilin family intramembrane aspartyl protease PSH [Halovenus sp. HT40]|uniref:presenilin family intramembrane aspartyl protease PSH n=1 Tax=Halovenus sp. HT40 TaxID=3126691 RepID=UPI00300F0B9C
MDHRQRQILASGAILGMFLVIQLGALALVEPFLEGGLQGSQDTTNPGISIAYIAGILVATVAMLGVIKYGGQNVLRLVIIFAGVYVTFFVFDALVPALGSVGGVFIADAVALVVALGLGAALYLYPEWYVIDAAGVIMGIGAAGLFGINFGILPALVLLTALAVYDAISVYGTEHMLTLASGMMEMRVPVVFVVPLYRSYSFLDESTPETIADDSAEDLDAAADETDLPTDPEDIDAATLNDLGPDRVSDIDDDLLAEADLGDDELDRLDDDVKDAISGGKRDALFIGLGDAVIPSVLVASAAFFIETGPTLSVLGISATLPAVTAMVGTLVGLTVLLWLVHQGRAHAGLPLLNGGTIAGYLIGALLSGLTLVEALGLDSFL